MVCKIIFFSSNSPIFPIRLAEKQEEYRQLQSVLRFTPTQQKVQGLQASAFSVFTVNDEHTKPRFK